MDPDGINACSRHVIAAALRVHSLVGPGLLEAAYESCLAHELRLRSLQPRRQVPLPITYDGSRIELAFRADLVVEDCLLVEVKAVKKVTPIHEARLLSYLRLSGFRLGLLINFHSLHLKDGISRLVNNLWPLVRISSLELVGSLLTQRTQWYRKGRKGGAFAQQYACDHARCRAVLDPSHLQPILSSPLPPLRYHGVLRGKKERDPRSTDEP